MSVEPGEVEWKVTRVGDSVHLEIADPDGTQEYLLSADDAAIVAALIVEAASDHAPDALDEDPGA